MLERIPRFIAVCLVASCIFGCGQDNELPPERAAEFDKQVRENMRTAQVAAEHHAADHGSINYPTSIDDMYKTYFPGGEGGRHPAPVGPVNPFTGENEFPFIGPANSKSAEELRRMKRFEVQRGRIVYIPLAGGKGYAIIGGAHDDKILVDDLNEESNLVYSNE